MYGVINTFWVIFQLGLGVVLLYLWPTLIRPTADYSALYLVPLLVFVQPSWSLIHEAVHRNLYSKRWLNDAAGRLLHTVRFAAPFDPNARGHILHHRYNEPSGYSSKLASRGTLSLSQQIRVYLALVVKPYTLIFLTTFLLLIPPTIAKAVLKAKRHREVIRYLEERKLLARARLDALLVIAVWGSAFYLYGADWWILAAALVIQLALLSFLDGMYHYQARPWRWEQGYNLKINPISQRLMLNFNLHGIHHSHLTLKWHELPAMFEAERKHYDGNYLAAALRQLQGPIAIPDDVINDVIASPRWTSATKEQFLGAMGRPFPAAG